MKLNFSRFSEEQKKTILIYHRNDYPLYISVSIKTDGSSNTLLQVGNALCDKIDLRVLCKPEENLFETIRNTLKSVRPVNTDYGPISDYEKQIDSVSDDNLLCAFGVWFTGGVSTMVNFELDPGRSPAGYLAEFIYNSGVEYSHRVKNVVLSVMLLNDKTDCRFFNGTYNATLNLDFSGKVPTPLSLNLAKEISKEAERFAITGGSGYKQCISDVAEALITALKESQPNEFIITEGKTCKVALLVNV